MKSVHRRNENYWRDPAHLEAIEITAITDPVARVNALLAGDFQMVTNMESKSFRQIESSGNVKLIFTPPALQLVIWNDTYWNNPRMGKLLTMSLSETNPERRHEMYCEMQTLIHEGSGMVIPAFTNINDGIANNVMGVPTVPLGQVGASEWPEFAWLA